MKPPKSLAVWNLILTLALIPLGPLSALLWPLLILTVPASIAAFVTWLVLVVKVLSMPSPLVPLNPLPPGQYYQQLPPGAGPRPPQ